MKAIFMLIVMVLMGLGYWVKAAKVADVTVPVSVGTLKGVMSMSESQPIGQHTVPPSQATVLSMSAEQMQIAKEVFESDKLMFYATPELQNLLKKAYQIDERLTRATHEPMGCEFYEENYFVGATVDDFLAKNLL